MIEMRHTHQSRHRAFTLIELLVTVAITGVLIGVMLPVLGHAKEGARSAVCMSNLRQLAVAAEIHAVDRRGYYPLAYDYGNPADGAKEWDFFKDKFINPTKVTPGFLWQGSTSVAVHQCPSYHGSANSSGDPYTGYNYNVSYIGGYREIGQTAIVSSARSDQVGDPAGTAIFGDGQYSAGANKFMRSPFPNVGEPQIATRNAGTQGYRHLGGATSVAYCDGHVCAHGDPYTSTDAASQALIAPGTGFLSEDNSVYDLR